VELGCGNIICAGTIITVNIKIGNHVIINLDCTVGHDTVINDYVTCAPSVNISGQVEIEEGCDIGTNAAIIQGKKIGKWSIIGAGAVVSRDIPPGCTAVGVPAKPLNSIIDLKNLSIKIGQYFSGG
jgi:sugar O-acyltransferase (sialic acid O-acetyltransferase NeuD family)